MTGKAEWSTGQVHLARASGDDCVAFANLAMDRATDARRKGDEEAAAMFVEEAKRFAEGSLLVGGMDVVVLIQPLPKGQAGLPPTAVSSRAELAGELSGGRPHRCDPDLCACVRLAREGNRMALLRTGHDEGAPALAEVLAATRSALPPGFKFDPASFRRKA